MLEELRSSYAILAMQCQGKKLPDLRADRGTMRNEIVHLLNYEGAYVGDHESIPVLSTCCSRSASDDLKSRLHDVLSH